MDVEDPGPTLRGPLHADEIALDETLVQGLLQTQCPCWADLPLVRLESAGTDHWLFRLGAKLLVRLPRRPDAAAQIAKAHEWLPRLAPSLPLRVPAPLFLGHPCADFPWPWSVGSWIEGEPAELRSLANSTSAAEQLGGFVKALQSQDARSGPPPGPHNSLRGEALIARDQAVRRNLEDLADTFDRDRALAAWDAALDAGPHQGAPKWIHGDLLQSNLLLQHGRLVAVIDFGLLGAGDPACDFMAGWTLFDASARARFREAAAADEAAWSRGRGWALAFAAVAYPYYRTAAHPLASVAARTLNEVISSFAGGER